MILLSMNSGYLITEYINEAWQQYCYTLKMSDKIVSTYEIFRGGCQIEEAIAVTLEVTRFEVKVLR